MKNTEKAYIKIILGTATWNVDLEQNGEQDILDEGIDCYPEEVYALIYEGYNISEDKLKMLLDEPDNSKNMLYPLDYQKDLSYDDWLEYKKEKDTENEIQEYFENHSVYKHRSNMKYEIDYKGKRLTSDCPRKLRQLLFSAWK